MAENKKYYFLKLKEDFFDQREIVVLEGSKDGILYVNILLKLYLKSLQHNGKLLLNEITPLSAEMIALLTRYEVGTVERCGRLCSLVLWKSWRTTSFICRKFRK